MMTSYIVALVKVCDKQFHKTVLLLKLSFSNVIINSRNKKSIDIPTNTTSNVFGIMKISCKYGGDCFCIVLKI